MIDDSKLMQSQRKLKESSTIIEQMPPHVRQALAGYEESYFDSIKSIAPSITKAVELLQRQTAKQVRPLLLLLTADSLGGINDRVIKGALFIELLHVSTLVHDDVIDESSKRRGVASMNAVFDNRKAVLIGDFLLANSMIQAIHINSQNLVFRLAKLGKNLSEGEILQMDTAELGDYSEKRYYEIIDRKTASLIESCMHIGAVLSGEERPEVLASVDRAGHLMGRAFQIKDDLLDYLPTTTLGKPSGQDVAEHKVTLPLIYALQQQSREREKVLKLLRHEELRSNEISFIIDFAIRMGGIDYATSQMEALIIEAKEILSQVLQPGESRKAMLRLADFLVTRER